MIRAMRKEHEYAERSNAYRHDTGKADDGLACTELTVPEHWSNVGSHRSDGAIGCVECDT